MITANRRIPMIAGAAALLILVAWYFLVWTPQTKHLASAHKAQVAAEQKISQLQEQQTQLQGLVKQIPSDTARFAQLEQALPDNPQLDQTLNQLQQAAVQSGVTLTSVSPNIQSASSGGTQTSAIPTVTLNMSFRGGTDQVEGFVSALNQLPRTFVVDRIAITNAGTQTTGNVVARIFYAGQPTP
jgi:type IV pilus assembly protein PilO